MFSQVVVGTRAGSVLVEGPDVRPVKHPRGKVTGASDEIAAGYLCRINLAMLTDIATLS